MPQPSAPSDASPADQIGQAAQSAAAHLNSGAHAVEDLVKRNIEKSKEKLVEAVDETATRVEAAHTYLSRQARERPVQTTAIALGVGVLLGLLMTGRRR